MKKAERFTDLTREQKQAIGLLSTGTFLEYFDLMLYVHMAVLLNDLFFKPTDPHTASIIAAFTFCSTYAMRPFAALIFGYIGDRMGRKFTVIITTTLMAISCIIMANMKTYAEIGIVATYMVILCRVIQGMSSMGEIIGAELYVTEITKPPIQYPSVALVSISSTLGGNFALFIAFIVTSYGLNWRIAFWVGALIAVIGLVARTTLRETPDFADAKRRIKKVFQATNNDSRKLEASAVWNQSADKRTALVVFLVKCGWPIVFYFVYVHCGHILKHQFSYSPAQIIQHNFIIGMIQLASAVLVSLLSYKIYPLLILRVKFFVFLVITTICPILLSNLTSPMQLIMLQVLIVIFPINFTPANPILFKHLPVFKRFTYGGVSYALSRLVMHGVTAFGLIYLVKYFGNWGILFITIPVSIAYKFGIDHFTKLEKQAGNYPEKKQDAKFIENESLAVQL